MTTAQPTARTDGARRVVLVDGCRTPFQRVATGFFDAMSYQLGAAAIGGLLARTGIGGEAVERVVLGATVSNPRTTNVAREAALAAGLPSSVPAMTVTAAGASASAAIAWGVDLIAGGQAEVVVAGGSDCISDPPIGYRRAMRQKLLRARRLRGVGATLRFLAGLRPRDFLPEIPDITEYTTGETMGQYTERLARDLGIGRRQQDEYAVRSHHRAAAARRRGHLAREIVPVDVSGHGSLGDDNGIRPDTSVEELARLRPSFDPRGTLTAGNSSFLTDGAAVVLLMSEQRARAEGLDALARIRGSVTTAHDPKSELLLGPVFATARVLPSAGLQLADVDVFELHEAFAAQVLAVLRLLASDAFARDHLGRATAVGEVPPERLNAWGGSLSIGNPFAPNGARLLTTAGHRLRQEDGQLALVATCAGGALGHAMILERWGG